MDVENKSSSSPEQWWLLLFLLWKRIRIRWFPSTSRWLKRGPCQQSRPIALKTNKNCNRFTETTEKKTFSWVRMSTWPFAKRSLTIDAMRLVMYLNSSLKRYLVNKRSRLGNMTVVDISWKGSRIVLVRREEQRVCAFTWNDDSRWRRTLRTEDFRRPFRDLVVFSTQILDVHPEGALGDDVHYVRCEQAGKKSTIRFFLAITFLILFYETIKGVMIER